MMLPGPMRCRTPLRDRYGTVRHPNNNYCRMGTGLCLFASCQFHSVLQWSSYPAKRSSGCQTRLGSKTRRHHMFVGLKTSILVGSKTQRRTSSCSWLTALCRHSNAQRHTGTAIVTKHHPHLQHNRNTNSYSRQAHFHTVHAKRSRLTARLISSVQFRN